MCVIEYRSYNFLRPHVDVWSNSGFVVLLGCNSERHNVSLYLALAVLHLFSFVHWATK